MLLRSPLLSKLSDVTHGFSTRHGGVSNGPFGSLNLGSKVGDQPTLVEENRRRFRDALAVEHVVEVEQVHGKTVIFAHEARASLLEGDAIISTEQDLAVAVRTADCTPILVAHASGGSTSAVAAIHAGWRGAVMGIVGATFEGLGAPRDQCWVAIGPTIGLDAFEVGEEVIEAARPALNGVLPCRRGSAGKWHLDLRELVRRQMIELGVPEDRIELVGGCTASEPEQYFSHRRDRGVTGRHASAIGIRRRV